MQFVIGCAPHQNRHQALAGHPDRQTRGKNGSILTKGRGLRPGTLRTLTSQKNHFTSIHVDLF
jgi:hypothetical protein